MKFNPLNKTIYTKDGKLIKKMYSSYSMLEWSDLSKIKGSRDKFCVICETNVVETKDESEDRLLALLRTNSETCIKIDGNLNDGRIVHHV